MMTFILDIKTKEVVKLSIFMQPLFINNIITKLKFVLDTNPILTFKVSL